MNPPRDRLSRSASVVLLVYALVLFACWLPGYLARPLFADHDVFATLARGWDAGLRPYRDLVSNNFPGTIYLFWGLGKAFGWESSRALYATDAALVVALVAALLGWSRARFGGLLPGTVGAVAFASYYFNLDFSQSAQRDWHAAAAVVLGLLAAQGWPGWGGRSLAALGFAAGMLVRPQVVLFLPAMLLAATERPRLAGPSKFARGPVAAAWLAATGLAVLVGFAPLIGQGLMGDFIGGLRALAYGGGYNKKDAVGVGLMLGLELIDGRVLVVIGSLAVLARWSGGDAGGEGRSLAATWAAALAGALLYAPLSPSGLPYLYHPLWVVWSVGVAAMVGLVARADAPPRGFLYALLALQLAGTSWPRYALPGRLAGSLTALAKGREIRAEPPGYQHPYGQGLVLPPWDDYRDLLDYLRARTGPSTRVANLLKGVAITGPTGRLPALPAESATWVFVVKPDDEEKFARALERSGDSVVVLWAPGEIGKYDHPLPKLDEVVKRLYAPEARFGTLEVWRRRPGG